MRKDDYLKICAKYPPVKEVLGELCWTPKVAAEAIGMSKNTILNWVHKKMTGEIPDMPVHGGKIKGSLVWIPIRRFLAWYGYEGQN